MKLFRVLFLFSLLLTASNSYANYCASENPDVQTYINQLVTKYNFDRKKLDDLFCTVTMNEEVVAKLSKPAEAKPWYQYKALLVTPDRITKGIAYWQKHEKTLELAEKKYGVPASIIVAIIGVETKYGENKGTFPVFNTLVTLAFNHGRRSDFFRSELTQYLLLARENNFKPLLLKGSYAGAVGLPQFMPSSYRSYAVDFNGRGRADLFNDDDDAIGSVANYLNKHGWKTGEPIAIPAKVSGNSYQSLLSKKYKPRFTESDLKQYNVIPAEPLNSKKASLIQLQNQDGYEYWLGLQNFYVISTYNNSELYVMAANVLAQKMREQKFHLHEKKVALAETLDEPTIEIENSQVDIETQL